MRLLRKIHDFWYYIKCVLWHKYNTVKARTLPPTWNDRDNLLVHTMFQILEDYVKRESHIIEWNSDAKHKKARKEMDELLDWWHNIYLKFDESEGLEFDWEKEGWDNQFIDLGNGMIEMKPLSESDREKYNIVHEREKQIEKELEKRLIRIIKLRGYLWS